MSEIYFIIVNNEHEEANKDFIIGPYETEDLTHHYNKNNIVVKWEHLQGFKTNELHLDKHIYIDKKYNINGTSKYVLLTEDDEIEFDELATCLTHINNIFKKNKAPN